MAGTGKRKDSRPEDASAKRFREQGDGGGAADATVPARDPLAVTRDEETGGDPYNHTGRFERSSR